MYLFLSQLIRHRLIRHRLRAGYHWIFWEFLFLFLSQLIRHRLQVIMLDNCLLDATSFTYYLLINYYVLPSFSRVRCTTSSFPGSIVFDPFLVVIEQGAAIFFAESR